MYNTAHADGTLGDHIGTEQQFAVRTTDKVACEAKGCRTKVSMLEKPDDGRMLCRTHRSQMNRRWDPDRDGYPSRLKKK